MANVLFKRGLQANLPSSGVIDGAFYLTTDTNRLYVGNAVGNDVELVELNKSITVVEDVAHLPTSGVQVGQFYYVAGTNLHNGESNSNGNILAVVTSCSADGTNPHWTQVNPDTNDNDNDHLGSVSVSKGTEANGVIPYTLTFQMVNKNNQNLTGTQPSVTFNIDIADIITLLDANVTVSAITNKTATITTKLKDMRNNTTTTGSSFGIKGGDNVTLTKDNDGNIVIDTGISSGSIQLAVDGTGTNLVKANVQVNGADSGDTLQIAGESGIGVSYGSVSGVTGNVVKVGHTNSVSNGTDGGSTETAATLANGGNFTAVIESKYDAYGHVTSQKKQTITLPTIYAGSIGVDSTDKGKLTFTVKDQNGTETTAATSSASVLYHTITVDGTEQTVTNQGSLGSFYSKDSIDSMMRSLDALTYKGTVASVSDIPDGTTAGEEIQVGDTYKVTAANGITYTYGGNTITAKQGDLLIATGTEGSDGYITANSLEWTVAAGGSDTDTTYNTKVTAGSTNVANVGIIASTAAGNFTQYVPFSGDGVVTVTATAGEGSNGSVALAHANSGATAGSYAANTAGAVAAGGNIVVPSLTVDAKGHVTAISDVTLSIPGAPKLAGDEANKQVKLQNSTGTDLGTITFSNGNMITATVAENGVNETVTFDHNTVATTNDTTAAPAKDLSSSTDSNRQITAISGITRDNYGHITAIETSTYTIGRIDDQLVQTITSTSAGASSIDSVTVSTDLQNYAGTSKGTSDFTLKSPNKTIAITNTANTSDINIDIVWGTF